MRSAPQSRLFAAICLIKTDRLEREPRLSRARLGFALPEHAEELTMPAQKCLWLDKEERLFPGPNHPGQKHQEKPVCSSGKRVV